MACCVLSRRAAKSNLVAARIIGTEFLASSLTLGAGQERGLMLEPRRRACRPSNAGAGERPLTQRTSLTAKTPTAPPHPTPASVLPLPLLVFCSYHSSLVSSPGQIETTHFPLPCSTCKVFIACFGVGRPSIDRSIANKPAADALRGRVRSWN